MPISTASTSAATSRPYYLPVRQDWLDRRKEPILEPDLPIVDPHHHLWDRPDWRYLLDELLAGHEQRPQHRRHRVRPGARDARAAGPVEMRHVGETEFVNGVAAMSASGIYGKTRHCAGIVGHADLALGGRVEPVLRLTFVPGAIASAASATSAPGTPTPRSAIRPTARRRACWATRLSGKGSPSSAGSACPSTPGSTIPRSMSLPISRASSLKRRLCSITLAARSGSVPMPAGTRRCFPAGPHRSRRLVPARMSTSSLAASACAWAALASTSSQSPRPPRRWQPRGAPTSRPASMHSAPSRCMFESNFPVDKGSYSYPVFWNACKLLTKGASDAEKADLFGGTATRFYRLDLDGSSQ